MKPIKITIAANESRVFKKPVSFFKVTEMASGKSLKIVFDETIEILLVNGRSVSLPITANGFEIINDSTDDIYIEFHSGLAKIEDNQNSNTISDTRECDFYYQNGTVSYNEIISAAENKNGIHIVFGSICGDSAGNYGFIYADLQKLWGCASLTPTSIRDIILPAGIALQGTTINTVTTILLYYKLL